MTEPNETVQSQLSAFVDNELPQDETELLARRLSRDTELQQSLGRYLLIGEALRIPSQARVSRDFSTRVAAAIEQHSDNEKREVAPVMKVVQRAWLKPAAGMTLAASVAAIAVMFVHNLQNTEVDHAAQMVSANTANQQLSSVPANSYVVPVATTAPSVPISAARLTNYVVAHSEFTSPLGRRNTVTGLMTGDQQTESADDTTDEAGTAK